MVTFPHSLNPKAWEVGIVSAVSQFQCLMAVAFASLFAKAEFCTYKYIRGSFKNRSTVLLDVKFKVAIGCFGRIRFR